MARKLTASYFAVWILSKTGIQDGIRYLVTNLICRGRKEGMEKEKKRKLEEGSEVVYSHSARLEAAMAWEGSYHTRPNALISCLTQSR